MSYLCIVRRSDTRRSDYSRVMKIFVYTFMKLYLYIVIWSWCTIFKFEHFVQILLAIIEIIFSIKLKMVAKIVTKLWCSYLVVYIWHNRCDKWSYLLWRILFELIFASVCTKIDSVKQFYLEWLWWHRTCVDREARNTCIECQGVKHVMILGMQVRGRIISSCVMGG